MTTIQEDLFAMQDLEYRDFHAKLIPNINKDTIIGVRTPHLRAYAKKRLQAQDYEAFLHELPHTYYEENNLHGMLIEKGIDFEKVVSELNGFLPYIDNWATCDMISPKVFKKHLPELLPQIDVWMASEHPYTIRFGIEMLMKFYLDEAFDTKYLEKVATVQSEAYYVRMMIAWYFATALAKQYKDTILILEEKRLDVWTHNKTIQKAIESYRIMPEQKDYLRSLRRKKTESKGEDIVF